MKWKMEKKIVVAGHVCVDMTPVFDHAPVEHLNDILIPGKLIHMNGITFAGGGVVTNTGLALKKLGANVSLMGKIGNDSLGELLAGIFNHYDAGKSMLRVAGSATSYTVAIAIPGIDRIFLHDPAANDTFCYEDLNFDEIADASIFHFGYPTIMRKMFENQGAELIRIFKQVHAMGVATSLDMAAIDPTSEAAKADWTAIIQGVLPYVDFFDPSVEELCYMIDRPRFEEWEKRAAGRDITQEINLDDIKPLAEKLMTWGAKTVLIKCGKPGLFLKTAGLEQMIQIQGKLWDHPEDWADLEAFEKSYVPGKVLSGTGAGDTCIAAFLLAISRGYTWKRCLQLAAGTGASCVEAYDSLSGLRSFETLLQKIDAGWEKFE